MFLANNRNRNACWKILFRFSISFCNETTRWKVFSIIKSSRNDSSGFCLFSAVCFIHLSYIFHRMKIIIKFGIITKYCYYRFLFTFNQFLRLFYLGYNTVINIAMNYEN